MFSSFPFNSSMCENMKVENPEAQIKPEEGSRSDQEKPIKPEINSFKVSGPNGFDNGVKTEFSRTMETATADNNSNCNDVKASVNVKVEGTLALKLEDTKSSLNSSADEVTSLEFPNRNVDCRQEMSNSGLLFSALADARQQLYYDQ